MKNLSIKSKLLIIVISTILLLSVLLGIQSIKSVQTISDEQIQEYQLIPHHYKLECH
jgi:hypothetical protein